MEADIADFGGNPGAPAAGAARRLQVVGAAEPVPGGDYPVAHCAARGPQRSRRVWPEDASLWLVQSVLEDGAELEWSGRHGDEGVYVAAGQVREGGRVCPSGGAVIVESDAPARLRASGPARLLHFGPADPHPPRGDRPLPPAVHVVGPGGLFARRDAGRDTRLFADSTCPGCRIFLLYTARSGPFDSAPHEHSQDELIHLLWGGISLGGRRLGPGDSVFIPAGQAYGFSGAPDGFGFVNYRRGLSRMTDLRSGKVRTEGGAAGGLERVDDLR